MKKETTQVNEPVEKEEESNVTLGWENMIECLRALNPPFVNIYKFR